LSGRGPPVRPAAGLHAVESAIAAHQTGRVGCTQVNLHRGSRWA